MSITIYTIDAPLGNTLRRKVAKALVWFQKNYMLKSDWTIDITFTNKSMCALGTCIAVPFSKYCEIKISLDQGDAYLITTLFHELIHARQYMMGHLKDGKSNKHNGYCYWLGKKVWYNLHYKTLYNILKYVPWERRAYLLAENYYEKYNG